MELVSPYDDFDPETVNVLNQIATLLSISRELHNMVGTFLAAEDIHYLEAKPHANLLLKNVRKTAKSLMSALFMKNSKRTEGLHDAQVKHFKYLQAATKAAKLLADMEERGMVGTNAKGNYIKMRVLKPLERLCTAWGNSE